MRIAIALREGRLNWFRVSGAKSRGGDFMGLSLMQRERGQNE